MQDTRRLLNLSCGGVRGGSFGCHPPQGSARGCTHCTWLAAAAPKGFPVKPGPEKLSIDMLNTVGNGPGWWLGPPWTAARVCAVVLHPAASNQVPTPLQKRTFGRGSGARCHILAVLGPVKHSVKHALSRCIIGLVRAGCAHGLCSWGLPSKHSPRVQFLFAASVLTVLRLKCSSSSS